MSLTQAHLCSFLFPCLWWAHLPGLEMPVFRKLFSIAVFLLSFVTFLSSRNLNRWAGTSRHALHVYPLILHTYSFIHFSVSWLYSLRGFSWLYLPHHQQNFTHVHPIISMNVILIIIFNFQVLCFFHCFLFYGGLVSLWSGNIFSNVSGNTNENFLLTRLKKNNKKKQGMHLVEFWVILKVKPEKAMAPHSSTLAWKIPWMEEPGLLPSLGSHRVGHNWSDLA